MNSLYKVFNNLNKFYTEINPATLTGAIDVVVVEQEDGSLHCSPFHVRFGKLGVLRSREKVVDIEVNGEPVDIHMKLGDSGEAFFVEEVAGDDETSVPDNLATSPIPTSQFMYEEEDDEQQQGRGYGAINAALISELELDSPRPRRNSFDLAEAQQQQLPLVVDSNEQAVAAAGLVVASGMTKYENQESGFTHRRYTTDSVQRDEMSKAKLQLTKQKIQQEWVGEEQPLVAPVEDNNSNNSNTNKSQETTTAAAADSTAMDVGDNGKDDAKSKKKRRKKSIMKKKNSQRKNSSSSSNGSAGSESTILGKDTDSSSSLPTPVASVKDTADSSVVVVVASGSVPSADGAEGAFKPIKPDRQMRDMDMHFFSDTEVTSTTGNRNSNDILSDTEFEMSQRSSQAGAEGQAAWKWGELPTGESAGGDERTKAVGQRKSMLTAMFSFMQQNRKGDGGLYLSDLDAEGMDPEVAALYFPEQRGMKKGTGVEEIEMELEANANGRTIKYPSSSGIEDDRESGNGTSLPHSPSSVELGSKMTMDSDLDESSRERNLECLAMSTCGGLENGMEPTADEFDKYLVTYSEACRNPSIFASPNLVVRLNNKYYTWAAACPIVMTMITFRKPLPQETVEQLVNVNLEGSSGSVGMKAGSAQPGGRGFGWFGWRRSTDKNTTPDKSFGKERSEGFAEQTALEGDAVDGQEEVPETAQEENNTVQEEAAHSVIPAEDPVAAVHEAEISHVTVQEIKEALEQPKCSSKDKYKKSLRLSSDQIEALNLKNGTNEVQFSVTTAYQGTSRCKCFVFYWKYNDKVVISDVDGTITKSDVLGHLMPLVGRDWAQIGVAELYSKIEENGYKMLYLSARAIGQSRTTREYLRSIRQGDVNLPDGPLLLNPTSLLSAFHREVIEKKPELFKIACLNDIKALFPSNPFYAGYGNRINDVWAYRAVGIPIERIFTINTKGELRHELTQTFQSSYCSLIDIADHLFPPIGLDRWSGYDEYSNFNFWRDPVPDIALDDLLLANTTPAKSSPKNKKQQKGDTGRQSTGTAQQLTTIPEK